MSILWGAMDFLGCSQTSSLQPVQLPHGTPIESALHRIQRDKQLLQEKSQLSSKCRGPTSRTSGLNESHFQCLWLCVVVSASQQLHAIMVASCTLFSDGFVCMGSILSGGFYRLCTAWTLNVPWFMVTLQGRLVQLLMCKVSLQSAGRSSSLLHTLRCSLQ